MIKRLICALAAVACLVGLAGCATSPSTYRVAAQVADDGKPVHWLLPPSADTWSSFRWVDSVPSRGFYIDLPLRHSACAYFAKFPEDAPKGGALQGEVLPAAGGVVLRMKSNGTFLDDTSLRAAWSAWWSVAKDRWPGKCLGIDEKVLGQVLVERSPLQISELLRLYYGFDRSTRSVILRPGTTVCVSDVLGHVDHPTARFSAAGESCATVMSDGSGGAVFWPLAIPLQHISGIDPRDKKTQVVHPIASWAELPHKDLSGHQFILRYPKSLPIAPSDMPASDEPHIDPGRFPMLIAVNTEVEGAVARAMRCVVASDKQIEEFCGNKGFEATACGGPLQSNDPLKGQPPKCFRFGERGVITPRITVTVNGAPAEVPLGTTLGAALERFAPTLPRGLQSRTSDAVAQAAAQSVGSGVRLMRMFEGRPVAVDLSGAGTPPLSMVLLPGDQLSW